MKLKMKMKMKMFFALLLLSSTTFAATAEPGDRNFVQLDGTSFTAELKGDEYFSWLEDSLGRVISYNQRTSVYEYSGITESNGSLTLNFSGVAAADNTPLFASAYSNVQVGIVDNLKLGRLWKQYTDAGLQDASRSSGSSSLVNDTLTTVYD